MIPKINSKTKQKKYKMKWIHHLFFSPIPQAPPQLTRNIFSNGQKNKTYVHNICPLLLSLISFSVSNPFPAHPVVNALCMTRETIANFHSFNTFSLQRKNLIRGFFFKQEKRKLVSLYKQTFSFLLVFIEAVT
jgi:hypothetical protein